MALIDAGALCADLREQWEQVFSRTPTAVRPEDFFIKRLAAFQAASIASDIEAFVEYLGSRPAVDAVPVVHGRYVHDGPRFHGGVDWWHCSNCLAVASGVDIAHNYCPNCGAKMDGGEDNGSGR